MREKEDQMELKNFQEAYWEERIIERNSGSFVIVSLSSAYGYSSGLKTEIILRRV